jgi:hypothetical protein
MTLFQRIRKALGYHVHTWGMYEEPSQRPGLHPRGLWQKLRDR